MDNTTPQKLNVLFCKLLRMVIGRTSFEPSESAYTASVEILTASKSALNAVMWSGLYGM